MQSLLENPALQSGFVPFFVALVIAALMARTQFAWVAVVAAYASMLALSTGISFTPLSASRKVQLLVLLAPMIGLILDYVPRPPKSAAKWLTVGFAALSVWVFWSVHSQREIAAALTVGAGLALFFLVLVLLTMRLREDGVVTAAAGVGLGIATGIGALLSASIGYFMSGIAMAAACGAILLVQFVTGQSIRAGFPGTLSIATASALFASATLMLAQLPWTALALMPVIPITAWLVGRVDIASARLRLLVVSLCCIVSSAAPLLAAWLATRATTS